MQRLYTVLEKIGKKSEEGPVFMDIRLCRKRKNKFSKKVAILTDSIAEEKLFINFCYLLFIHIHRRLNTTTTQICK